MKVENGGYFTEAEFVPGEVRVWARPRKYYDPDGLEPFVYELRTDTCYAEGAVDVTGPVEISIPVPAGVNLVERAVLTLNEKKDLALKEYLKTCEELNKQIERLTLITHQPEDY